MLVLPFDLTRKFQTLLAQACAPVSQRPNYQKWLRYYLVFATNINWSPLKNVTSRL